MNECEKHPDHNHQHEPECVRVAIEHDGHTDYLHDGHLHHAHNDHVDEHALPVNATNPDSCSPDHDCGEHDQGHVHGPDCGHEQVPHGDHVGYLVQEHLHHPHGDHCDDHGRISVKA